MPQTMLALLALMIGGLFVYSQQQNTAQLRLQQIRMEIAVQTTSVAEDVISFIGSRQYDRVFQNKETIHSPSELTPTSEFGEEGGTAANIEDFHERTLKENDFRIRTIGEDTLRFEVETRISYADENDMEQEVTSQTKVKKVTVLAYNKNMNRPDTVRISRSFTCGSRCDW